MNFEDRCELENIDDFRRGAAIKIRHYMKNLFI